MDDLDELNSLSDRIYTLEAALVAITNLLIERGNLDRRETAGFLRYIEQLSRDTAKELDYDIDRSDLIRIADDIEGDGSPPSDPPKPGSPGHYLRLVPPVERPADDEYVREKLVTGWSPTANNRRIFADTSDHEDRQIVHVGQHYRVFASTNENVVGRISRPVP